MKRVERIQLICKYCKKEFYIRKAELKRNYKKSFCNRNCYAQFQKTSTLGEGNSFYGKKHKKETIEEMRNIKLENFKQGISHSWNKGLTKETDERVKKYSLAFKEAIKNNPNFAKKGKHHTPEAKQLQRESKLGEKNPMYGKPNKNKDKTWEEIYGKEKAEQITKKRKEARSKQIFPLKDSKPEIKIQNYLKELGIEFFTHQYMKIEHGYQCDILIPSLNMVIECDGNYWHKYPIGTDIDHIRTQELIANGFKVLRLWEINIIQMSLEEFNEILEKMKQK